ncbi:unnamed protein product, partial [Brassica napus]
MKTLCYIILSKFLCYVFLFSKTLVFVVFPREPCLYFPCIFETLCMYKASPLYSGRGPLYQ